MTRLRGLRHPRRGRVGRGAQDPDAAGRVLDDREDVQARAGHGHRLEEVARQQRLGLGMQECGPGGRAAFGRGVDPGIFEDLPDGGRCDFRAQHQQFAVQAPIPHPGLAQHQGADRAHRTWPPDALGPGTLCVSACQQVPVPSQQGVRFDDLVQVPQHTLGQPVQQCCEQGSVARGEPYSVRTQLPLQDGDLMP